MYIFCNFLRNLITYYWLPFLFIHRNVFYHFSPLKIIQDAPIPGLLGCFHSSLLYSAVCWASLWLSLGTYLIILFSVLEVKLMLLVPCTFFKKDFTVYNPVLWNHSLQIIHQILLSSVYKISDISFSFSN